jgi:hypothetical protein
MSATQGRSNDMKFEIVVIPVPDVDRAKEFCWFPWRLRAGDPAIARLRSGRASPRCPP